MRNVIKQFWSAMKILLLSLLVALLGCSSSKTVLKISQSKEQYKFVDISGEYVLGIEKGRTKDGRKAALKRVLAPKDDPNKPFEKSVSISTPGKLKNKVSMMRPDRSQYEVWFDKQKYTSRLVLDLQKKVIVQKLVSPEEKWNKVVEHSIPKGTGLFCFYFQLADCISYTGFVREAIDRKGGTVNFHMIWEGHPYYQEMYKGLNNELISPASLTFSGQNKDGLYRFTLQVANHSIFYFFNRHGKMIRKFWIAQGLSVTPIDES